MFYSFPAPSNEASDAGVVAVLLRRQIVTHTCMFLFQGEFLVLVKGRDQQRSPEPGREPASFPAALCQKSPDVNPCSAAALHPPRPPTARQGPHTRSSTAAAPRHPPTRFFPTLAAMLCSWPVTLQSPSPSSSAPGNYSGRVGRLRRANILSSEATTTRGQTDSSQ